MQMFENVNINFKFGEGRYTTYRHAVVSAIIHSDLKIAEKVLHECGCNIMIGNSHFAGIDSIIKCFDIPRKYFQSYASYFGMTSGKWNDSIKLFAPYELKTMFGAQIVKGGLVTESGELCVVNNMYCKSAYFDARGILALVYIFSNHDEHVLNPNVKKVREAIGAAGYTVAAHQIYTAAKETQCTIQINEAEVEPTENVGNALVKAESNQEVASATVDRICEVPPVMLSMGGVELRIPVESLPAVITLLMENIHKISR